MATDLERFVSAPGRDDLVKKVREQIDACGRHVHLLPVHLGHGPDHGQGRARGALGVDGAQGLPARLRRDRQPLRRPARRVHRLRPRGGRARRPARARDVPGAAVGPEGRARLVHLLPRPRGPRGRRLVPHGRLPQQPQADPGRVHRAHRHAPARRPRARDDLAQGRRGRHADLRGHVEALLLPHRPVQPVPADHPQGDRVRERDGPRHDPGRPRGRARPARAELQLRHRREDRRQPLHLPPGVQAGRARDAGLPVLHAQAVHGRLGQRLPPQHLALGRRRQQVHARARTRISACPARSASGRSAASSSTSAR